MCVEITSFEKYISTEDVLSKSTPVGNVERTCALKLFPLDNIETNEL